MKIAVVVASAGRPQACSELMRAIDRSPRPPDLSIAGYICVPTRLDAPDIVAKTWLLIVGPRGAATQRNAVLDILDDDVDLVCFLDDDSIPHPDFFLNAAEEFASHPSLVVLNATPLRDGAIEQRELALDDALDAFAAFDHLAGDRGAPQPIPHAELYACGALVRWEAAKSIRFDERLPLYSWLEDRDFAIRLSRQTPSYYFAKSSRAVFVHRAIGTGGRANHRRLGYSQVANPVWLHEKGSFSTQLAARFVVRAILGNAFYAIFPLGGRKGRGPRLAGNALALYEIARGGFRANPERILTL